MLRVSVRVPEVLQILGSLSATIPLLVSHASLGTRKLTLIYHTGNIPGEYADNVSQN